MSERFDLYLNTRKTKIHATKYIKAYHHVTFRQVVVFCKNLPAPFSVCITAKEAAERSRNIIFYDEPIGEVEIKPTIYKETQLKNRYDLMLQSYDDEEYIKYAMTVCILQKVIVPENRGYLNFDKLPKTILTNAIEEDVITIKEIFEKAGGKLAVVPTQFADPHLAPVFSFFKP